MLSISFKGIKSCDNLINILKAAKTLGIKSVTYYLFSTENWSRHQSEIISLMQLLEIFLTEQKQNMIDEGIRFQTIGDLSKFSESNNRLIDECKNATAHCKNINMICGLNYGGRDELKRAFQKMLEDSENGLLRKQDVTESLISKYLDTALWRDPELLIRTSGENRMSNFLIWQTSYTENYICDVYWPDFKPKHLLDALLDYQRRHRRLGGG